MIDKINNYYVLVCDGCGESESFDSFEEAVDFAKNNDWQFKKVNGEWENYCIDCSEE